MQINLNSDQESQTSGVEVAQMRFDTRKQAKLFHMLSSSLYSNKPASIIRELCSNCHDSHVMAGKTHIPFEMVGPTFENPQLVVRDFGVGLTADEALETILCYLGSNKDTSDDYIGGWGIGSKSPFAYAKNYNVVVVKNGVRAEFACWKDEHGLPSQALISQEPTDLPNGVEMIVPIEPEDIRRFCDAIDEYMNWTNYNVKTFNNAEELVRRPAVETVPAADGSYTLELFERGTGAIRMVYGGQSYNMAAAVDDRFDYSSDWKKMEEAASKAYDIAVVIHKPGSIDFNMNREELEQTDKTRAFVRGVVAYVSGEGNKHARVYADEIEAWKLDMAVRTKAGEDVKTTFADVDAIITKALEKGNSPDRFFGKAFRVFDQKFRYDLKASAHRVSMHSGVQRMHSIELVVAELHTQFMFVYARIMGLNHAQRRLAAGKANGKTAVYVKAENEEQFNAWIASHPDFSSLDMTKFQVEFVDFPAARSYNPKAASPRIYCAHRKDYKKFNPYFTYVEATPEQVEKWPDDIQFIVNMPLSDRNTVRAPILFVPTYDFKKRYFDKTTNSWTLSCVVTVDHFISEHMEKAEKALASAAGFWGRRGAKLEELADALDQYTGNLPGDLDAEASAKAKSIHDRIEHAKKVLDGVGLDRLVAAGHGVSATATKSAALLLREVRRVAELTRYLNVDTVEKHLTYTRFAAHRPAAEALVKTLGLEKYFLK